MTYTAYIITNTITGQQYVGITKYPLSVRFNGHLFNVRKGCNNLLYCAIREYGVDNFKMTALESDISEEHRQERERYYIEKYNTYYLNGNGYNMTVGGNGTIGYKFTDEDKQKVSDSGKGRVFSKERNEKISKAMKGRYIPQEWREKISKFASTRTGDKNPFYGKHHSEYSKSKIRESKNVKLVERLDVNTSDVLQIYDSITLAAEWVIKNNLSTAKVGTCRARIHKVCTNFENSKIAYGYGWKYKERCND